MQGFKAEFQSHKTPKRGSQQKSRNFFQASEVLIFLVALQDNGSWPTKKENSMLDSRSIDWWKKREKIPVFVEPSSRSLLPNEFLLELNFSPFNKQSKTMSIIQGLIMSTSNTMDLSDLRKVLELWNVETLDHVVGKMSNDGGEATLPLDFPDKESALLDLSDSDSSDLHFSDSDSSSDGRIPNLRMNTNDRAWATISQSSESDVSCEGAKWAPPRRALHELPKNQQKASEKAKTPRKCFICDRCGQEFRNKTQITNHMLQVHLPRQKPVASAGSVPWYRKIRTNDRKINRSNQIWKFLKQQDEFIKKEMSRGRKKLRLQSNLRQEEGKKWLFCLVSQNPELISDFIWHLVSFWLKFRSNRIFIICFTNFSLILEPMSE